MDGYCTAQVGGTYRRSRQNMSETNQLEILKLKVARLNFLAVSGRSYSTFSSRQ